MNLLKNTKKIFLKQRWIPLVGLILTFIWTLPYLFTKDRIEWGDFSMFVQAYEAIRITVLQYGQFPWFNAWMAAGTPLYANPQIGVFSLQTLLTFMFGAPIGIKVSLIIYTIISYISMLLLTRGYLKASWTISTIVSFIWILNSFFIAHLPSHYTFIWYMLAPLFIYLSLTFDRLKYGGALLGGVFGVMALSQVHNPFFHVSLICSVIIIIRVGRRYRNFKQIGIQLLIAAATFLLLAGHRLLFTIQNALEFPRVLLDQAASVSQSVLAFLIPYRVPQYTFIQYPLPPFGWQEITAYIGLGTLAAFFVSLVFIGHKKYINRSMKIDPRLLIALLIILITFVIGLGAFFYLAPYNILKSLPVISSMRVSSRWFIFTLLAILIAVTLLYAKLPKGFPKVLVVALLICGAGELFISDYGYQKVILSHDVTVAQKDANSYTFEQSKQFGSSLTFSDGPRITNPDSDMPHFYREYEATTFNIGTIQANDSLIDLSTKPTPRCGYEDNCPFVLTSATAQLLSWSPNKIVLKRIAPGPISLNMNNSRYFTINGKRDTSIRVVEAYSDFIITDPASTIVIEASPLLQPFIVSKNNS